MWYAHFCADKEFLNVSKYTLRLLTFIRLSHANLLLHTIISSIFL